MIAMLGNEYYEQHENSNSNSCYLNSGNISSWRNISIINNSICLSKEKEEDNKKIVKMVTQLPFKNANKMGQ